MKGRESNPLTAFLVVGVICLGLGFGLGLNVNRRLDTLFLDVKTEYIDNQGCLTCPSDYPVLRIEVTAQRPRGEIQNSRVIQIYLPYGEWELVDLGKTGQFYKYNVTLIDMEIVPMEELE